MKYRYICGIDPAPSKLGLSFLEVDTFKVNTFLFTSHEEKDFRFHAWLSRVGDIFDSLVGKIEQFLREKSCTYPETLFVMEYPVPFNISSPIMYGLDYMILLHGMRNCNIVLAHPNKIHMLAGKKSSKTEIKNFMLYVALENKFQFTDFTKKGDVKIPSDCADALLLIQWAYHNFIGKLNIPMDLSMKWEDKFSVLSEKESIKMRGLQIYYVDN